MAAVTLVTMWVAMWLRCDYDVVYVMELLKVDAVRLFTRCYGGGRRLVFPAAGACTLLPDKPRPHKTP